MDDPGNLGRGSLGVDSHGTAGVAPVSGGLWSRADGENLMQRAVESCEALELDDPLRPKLLELLGDVGAALPCAALPVVPG